MTLQTLFVTDRIPGGTVADAVIRLIQSCRAGTVPLPIRSIQDYYESVYSAHSYLI